MKYWVTYRIDARFIAEVEAENVDEAMEKAEEKYLDADFGAAKAIEGEPIIVQDDNDCFVWER